MGGKLSLTFDIERQTKNTVRYKERVDGRRGRAVVGTLYILKPNAEALGNPASIQVEISNGRG